MNKLFNLPIELLATAGEYGEPATFRPTIGGHELPATSLDAFWSVDVLSTAVKQTLTCERHEPVVRERKRVMGLTMASLSIPTWFQFQIL